MVDLDDIEWVSKRQGGLRGMNLEDLQFCDIQPATEVGTFELYSQGLKSGLCFTKRPLYCHHLNAVLKSFGIQIRQWEKTKLQQLYIPRDDRGQAEPSRGPKTGQIYFISCEGLPAVKIGWSMCVESRMSTIQTYCPFELTLLGQFPGKVSDEQELHRRFAHIRIRGEWFSSTPELLAFIAEVSQ